MTGLRVMVVVISLALAASASDVRQYSPESGPYRVLTVDQLVLHDAARNQDLPVKIYYPEGPGPFPVIIFSHGAFASKDTYWALGQYWASYGYVSIHPSHADSRRDSGYRGTLRQVMADSALWENRPRDISFVIDSLPQIEQLAPQLKGKLDRRRIGVGGHSYGAYTAEAIGGASVLMPGESEPRSFADPRVKAVVVLSPQGEGEMGLTARSWDNIRRPMLAMYGSRDFGTQRRTPTWRSQPSVLSRAARRQVRRGTRGRHALHVCRAVPSPRKWRRGCSSALRWKPLLSGTPTSRTTALPASSSSRTGSSALAAARRA